MMYFLAPYYLVIKERGTWLAVGKDGFATIKDLNTKLQSAVDGKEYKVIKLKRISGNGSNFLDEDVVMEDTKIDVLICYENTEEELSNKHIDKILRSTSPITLRIVGEKR